MASHMEGFCLLNLTKYSTGLHICPLITSKYYKNLKFMQLDKNSCNRLKWYCIITAGMIFFTS